MKQDFGHVWTLCTLDHYNNNKNDNNNNNNNSFSN